MANQDKMPCKYETFKDLHDRLDGSIVLYKDYPYYCMVKHNDDGVGGDIFLIRMDEYDGRQKANDAIKVDIKDPDLDISSVDLGYVNFEHRDDWYALYLYRTTAKRFKQALYPSYISAKSIDGQNATAQGVWTSRSGFDILTDTYPDLGTALKEIDTRYEVAISRDVALRKLKCGIILVYLRTKEVAWIDPRSNEMIFSEKSDWVDKKYTLRFPWGRVGIHAQ